MYVFRWGQVVFPAAGAGAVPARCGPIENLFLFFLWKINIFGPGPMGPGPIGLGPKGPWGLGPGPKWPGPKGPGPRGPGPMGPGPKEPGPKGPGPMGPRAGMSRDAYRASLPQSRLL